MSNKEIMVAGEYINYAATLIRELGTFVQFTNADGRYPLNEEQKSLILKVQHELSSYACSIEEKVLKVDTED